MSAAVSVDSKLQRTFRFYDATIGKKAVMAVTGLILFGFVVSHLAGNLQVFSGREKINHYAAFLRTIPAALWGARIVLLLSVILHIVASVQLWALQKKARPIGYVKKQSIGSSYASRTMYWSGPIVAAFIVYHLLHFTFGVVHPDFKELDVYDNLVNGFRVIPVSIAYIIAISLLGTHLYHGLWSVFQTLGANHPRYSPMLRRIAAIVAILIVAGYISIPIGVMTGIIGSELNATRV